MKREETIKWVKFVHDVLYEDKDEDIRTALNMAIEALSAEPKWNCTASFVAEQLERLTELTSEERVDFLYKFLGITDKDNKSADSLLNAEAEADKESGCKLDLISRADAIAVICKEDCDGTEPYMCGAYINNDCPPIKAIRDLPSADRPSGEWQVVETTVPMHDRYGVKCWGSIFKCDQCGFTTYAVEGHFSQYSYCPCCGAKMEETK